MRKAIITLVATAILAGCGPNLPKPTHDSTGETVMVAIETVRPTLAPVYFESTGTVKAKLNATLSSKVMARVVSVSAREGDVVKAGQLLVSLDQRELTAGVDVARANLNASIVGVATARTSHEMEVKTSAARIAQADAALQQARAASSSAQSKLDLALAGPRRQEKAQAHLAVTQADSSLRLAKTQLDRVSGLVAAGAMPRRDLDVAQNAYEVTLAERDAAVQNAQIADEGTRSEELRSAREGLIQAQAAVKQAAANLSQAKAAALQAKVRAEEIRSAQAQVNQSAATLQSLEVGLGYASVAAPFDGRIVQRSVDPGSMAAPGSPLLMIEGGELRLEAVVPESVLARVRIHDKVKVKLDALGADFDGTVTVIVPQGDGATHSFIVKIALPGSARIKSGMFGRAYFITSHECQIRVPKEATWEREGLTYLYAVDPEGITRLRIITLGDTSGDKVAVLSGLEPGDRIVATRRDKVSDGSKVVPS